MHELSLAQSMLRIIEETLGGRRPLVSATVTVGAFSGIEAESLRFCFTEIAKVEGFGEPELVVNQLPLKARCEACGAEFAMKDVFEMCPQCGSMNRNIEGGFEFTLDAVEMMEEDGDEATEED